MPDDYVGRCEICGHYELEENLVSTITGNLVMCDECYWDPNRPDTGR